MIIERERSKSSTMKIEDKIINDKDRRPKSSMVKIEDKTINGRYRKPKS